MKEIKLHYTEEFLRQVTRDSYFNKVKGLRAWIGPIIVLSWACFLLMTFFLAKHDWILVALTTAVACEVLFYFRNYREAMLVTLKAFREGKYEGFTLTLTEGHLAMSTANWAGIFGWKAYSKIERHPTYWRLFGPASLELLLPLYCLDAEDREFFSSKTQAAKKA
jgi:uncharacterized membrane protein